MHCVSSAFALNNCHDSYNIMKVGKEKKFIGHFPCLKVEGMGMGVILTRIG